MQGPRCGAGGLHIYPLLNPFLVTAQTVSYNTENGSDKGKIGKLSLNCGLQEAAGVNP
jgi:hypothetical protein